MLHAIPVSHQRHGQGGTYLGCESDILAHSCSATAREYFIYRLVDVEWAESQLHVSFFDLLHAQYIVQRVANYVRGSLNLTQRIVIYGIEPATAFENLDPHRKRVEWGAHFMENIFEKVFARFVSIMDIIVDFLYMSQCLKMNIHRCEREKYRHKERQKSVNEGCDGR